MLPAPVTGDDGASILGKPESEPGVCLDQAQCGPPPSQGQSGAKGPLPSIVQSYHSPEE